MVSTNTKLAEALTLGLECAYELLAEKRQALAGHPEKVAPYQEMADYLRTFPERFTIPQPALAQRREPLTDAEIEEILHGEIALNPGEGCAGRFARAIERAHGIGATPGEQR